MEEENSIMQYELIPGFRASSRLLYIRDEQQIYKCKYSNKSNIKYYYCYQKNCKAGVAVELNDTKYCRRLINNETHSHQPQSELYEKLKVINEIKCEVKNAPLKRSSVREIFEEQCKKWKEASGGTSTLDYERMRRQLSNIKKQQNMPESPKTFINVRDVFENEKVVKQFAMSRHEKEKPFYVDTIITENFSYALFVSPTILEAIKTMPPAELNNYYVFDTNCDVVKLSKEFKQLLVIYIVHNEHAFPFIYALMSTKTEEAYTHILQYLKSNMLDLQPITVIADYEYDLRNAIKNVYPTVKILCCWFHYINALRQKALNIPEFIGQIKQNTLAKLLFNKFFYLPLLKPNHIREAYHILKTDAMDAKYIKENMTESFFQPFINYFETFWIKNETVMNFSVYNEPLRTSSTAENFRKQFYIKMPATKNVNFYKFLNVLCDLDASKSSDFEKSLSGCTLSTLNTTKRNSSHYEQRYKFIQKQYQLFEEKQLTLNNLLAQFPKMENCMIEESCDNDDNESSIANISVEQSESDYTHDLQEQSDDAVEMQEQSNHTDGICEELDPLCTISFDEERKIDPSTISFEDESPIDQCAISCEEEREIDTRKHFKFCQPCYQQMKQKVKGMECKNCVQFALHYKV